MTAPPLSRRAALLLPLAAALPHRAHAATAPIIDAAGRSITLKAPPERVVIIFNYEEFTAIAGPAGWNRVVGFGRNQWAGYRQANFVRYAAAIPALNGLADVGIADDKSFSVERTLSLRPDLLIVHEYAYRSMSPLMQQIEAAGVPILVIDYNAQDPQKHVASTMAMGQAMGTVDRAKALSDLYLDRMADIVRRRGGKDGGRVYVEIGRAGAGTYGNTYNNTMWGRMVEAAGGANVAKGAIPTGWAPMSPEAILAASPDFVFITGSSWANAPNAVRAGYDVDPDTARRSLAPYAERPGWATLPAIRSGELHVIETGLARSLCDWVATQYIASRLYPVAFQDVDPVDSLRQYHAQFLPVAFTGTWMAHWRPSNA
ncbi:MAG: ABC transporter substrate-binding protein [Acetobacteraceae bacterium]